MIGERGYYPYVDGQGKRAREALKGKYCHGDQRRGSRGEETYLLRVCSKIVTPAANRWRVENSTHRYYPIPWQGVNLSRHATA